MKILYTITLIFLLQLQVFADIPFIQTSDSHSAYDKVERLILYSHYLHQKYKTKLNLDNMYLIHSGDLSGASEWTDFDKGKILYDVKMSYYSQLALTMGNHDGMDYDSSDVAEADRYFTQETKEFIKKNKTALLGANIRIKDSKYKNFFQPSVDFLLDEVKKTKVRVVGLVFAEFTGFINSGMPGVADETVAMFEEAKKQIEMAAKDTSIKRVIFSCHERYAPVEELSKEIFEWKKLHPEYSHIKTDLYFSAHDHERVFKRLESGYIINSGYQMEAMTFFVLDSEGNFSHKPEQVIFNEVDEVKLQQIKLSWRNKLPVQTIKELDELELLMKKVILDNKIILEKNVPIIPYTRSDLKAGRHILGMALSDSYVEFAKKQLLGEEFQEIAASKEFEKKYGRKLRDKIISDLDSSPEHIFSVFNSGSYRAKEKLNDNSSLFDLNKGDVKEMLPFPGKYEVFFLTGNEFNEMYAEASSFKKEFIPQLSSNIRENSINKQLEAFSAKSMTWIPLESDKHYPVVLTAWLRQNGWSFSSWARILSKAPRTMFSESLEKAPLEAFIAKFLKTWMSKDVIEVFNKDKTCDLLFKTYPEKII